MDLVIGIMNLDDQTDINKEGIFCIDFVCFLTTQSFILEMKLPSLPVLPPSIRATCTMRETAGASLALEGKVGVFTCVGT